MGADRPDLVCAWARSDARRGPDADAPVGDGSGRADEAAAARDCTGLPGNDIWDLERLGSFQQLHALQLEDSPREKGLGMTMHAVDLKTGKCVWHFGTGNNICGGPAIAYGRLYFHSRDGRVYCFTPAGQGEPKTPEAKDHTQSAPPDEVASLLAPELADRPRKGKDWPMQGENPERCGLEGIALTPPLELAWKLDTGDRIVSSAAVRDNMGSRSRG